jgi:hypothetical protein
VDAFLAGALLGVPAFLVRAAAGEGLGDALAIAALLLGGLVAVRRWPESRRPLAAAAIGVAAALGFAASRSSRILVGVLHPLLYMLSALGGPLALRDAARVIFAWQHDIPWRPADQWLYYAVVPAAAALLAAAAARQRVSAVAGATA